MNAEVKVYERENGEIQRVQVVRWDDWSQLDFLWLKQETAVQQVKALECFRDIYQNYLVPVMPWIFPQMVMFSLPEDMDTEELLNDCLQKTAENVYRSKRYGAVSDKLTAVTMALQDGIKRKNGKLVFASKAVERFYRELETRDCVRIVHGKLPKVKVIPVGRFAGYLSQVEPTARMKVNANFFIMDAFDCATIFDQIGTPLGLCVKDGVIKNPPLFGREALLVKKGVNDKGVIREIDVRDLEIEIRGVRYKHGKNATIYSRPERAKTPKDSRTKLVIIGRRVIAVKNGGSIAIPASGYVLCLDEKMEQSVQVMQCGDLVSYHGLEEVQFGIQVGNSIIRDGAKTLEFISKFYNIYHLERVPFPPSLYPMNFEEARAARIALGADKVGKPVLFWAEGKGKIAYKAGEDSVGASLTEMAEIAEDLGLHNAVNLDGGGSAQILVNGIRSLHISDRNKEDNSDAERLVPLGLVVK